VKKGALLANNKLSYIPERKNLYFENKTIVSDLAFQPKLLENGTYKSVSNFNM